MRLLASTLAALGLAACSSPREPLAPVDLVIHQRARLLSPRELVRTLEVELGADVPIDRIRFESSSTGFDNGPASAAFSPEQLAAWEPMAEELAERALTAPGRAALVAGCAPSGPTDAACFDRFVATVVQRLYRRPVTGAEAARLRQVFTTVGALEGSFDAGLAAALEAALLSPSFLYRTELRMNDFEIAAQLSYLLTGRGPDAPLLQAAHGGRLSRPEVRRAQAERLLASPESADQLRAFFHQWLATDRLASINKDPTAFPAFGPALTARLRDELDALYDQSARGQPLATLLTSGGGVLSRGGFLTVHAGYADSGPIARGVFIRSMVMCVPLLRPPAGVAQLQGSMTGHKTTRQKYEAHSADRACRGCHRAIDGIGFGLESFDGVGAARTTENGEPIDDSGEVVDLTSEPIAFHGPAELGAILAGRPEVRECLARQVYRYTYGEFENETSRGAIDWLAQELEHHSLADTLALWAATPAFVERRPEAEGAE